MKAVAVDSTWIDDAGIVHAIDTYYQFGSDSGVNLKCGIRVNLTRQQYEDEVSCGCRRPSCVGCIGA